MIVETKRCITSQALCALVLVQKQLCQDSESIWLNVTSVQICTQLQPESDIKLLKGRWISLETPDGTLMYMPKKDCGFVKASNVQMKPEFHLPRAVTSTAQTEGDWTIGSKM